VGTLCENVGTFMIISLWILLRIRNVLDKSCRENQNTCFTSNNFSLPKILPFMRYCGKNMVTPRQATDDNIIRHMWFASWLTKITDPHSEYVILIAFPWQQSLCKHVSVLHYTYFDSLNYNFLDGVKWILWYCDCCLAYCTTLIWQVQQCGVLM
jgi:hypothetical protein